MTATDLHADTDARRLLAAIDDGDDSALPALCDWMEERGDVRAAAGLRRLVAANAGQHVDYAPHRGMLWLPWPASHSPYAPAPGRTSGLVAAQSWDWCWYPSVGGYAVCGGAKLPWWVFDRLQGGERLAAGVNQARGYRRRADALLDLALALAPDAADA